jgi:hypothetical protein
MDRKRRRAGAIAHALGNCDTDCDGDGDGHAELNPASYSRRAAASDTRTAPDILNSCRGLAHCSAGGDQC